MQIDDMKNKQRSLTVIFDEGNFLLTEVVVEGSERREDNIWLSPEEIERLNAFKMHQTGERQ